MTGPKYVGPLLRGGKGKTIQNKRKRDERDGDGVSKRRSWESNGEYMKIDSSILECSRGFIRCCQLVATWPDIGMATRPEEQIAIRPEVQNLFNMSCCMTKVLLANQPKEQTAMWPESQILCNTNNGQAARGTNSHQARSTTGHTARGTKEKHNRHNAPPQRGDKSMKEKHKRHNALPQRGHKSNLLCPKRGAYDVLPDLNSAGQQTQTLGVEWQSGETWMECAGDGYLDMMSPEEQ